MAEADAVSALRFADWALNNAHVAVLTALEYRVEANARAKMAGV